MSVNKVILVGNLGKDPELRYTPSGAAVVNFSLATSETYKDRDGNKQTKTEWHNIVAWKQLAEICGKYLHKGKQVYIDGSLQTRKWQDRDGNDRYTTEIVANQMQMLGGRDDGQGGGQNHGHYQPANHSQQPVNTGGSGGHSGGRSGGQGQPRAGYQNDPNYRQKNDGPMFEEPVFDPDSEIPF